MEVQWQDALSTMVYGIYVLTTGVEESINGMIASWVTQVSYEPPLILVAVHPHRRTHGLIMDTGAFVLHSLSSEQKDLLAKFKGPDPKAKFDNLEWETGQTGCPILRDCVAFLECELRETYEPGNHTLFVGQVVNGRRNLTCPVLTTLDYSGTYTGKV